MLINLTNHPSTGWNEKQLSTARETFGCIEDIAFPNILPEMDGEGIEVLVGDYVGKVLELGKNEEVAVHVMGEMVFVYRFVSKMKELGIRCFASTTERITSYDAEGKKISIFNFIQFREY